MQIKVKKINLSMAVISLLFASTVLADTPVVEISIKNHLFEPSIVNVPVGVKVKLLVKNNDPTPEEFESYELNREKIIPGNSQAVIFVGPLDAGEYPFFGEFNESTAQGKIIAK